MNETLKVISERYSCRAFDGVMPERAQLEAIATAAIQSPSGMNRQPWKVFVITNAELLAAMDKEGMEELAVSNEEAYERMMTRGGKLFYNAPCMFLIAKLASTDLDCGIVSENIALAASSMGLGNVICGLAGLAFSGANADELCQKIGFPEGYEFGMSVLVGHAVNSGTPHEADKDKIAWVE